MSECLRNILFGNGINIQFGGLDYLSKNIIKRALKNIREDNFPKEIYPKEVGEYLIMLHNESKNILKGKYDSCAITEKERYELKVFKNQYRSLLKKSKVSDIGFEDYFLINQLVLRKTKASSHERLCSIQGLECLFIDSVYNNGLINELHNNYPRGFKEWLGEYKNVFTTNYDRNIEIAGSCDVKYLHGAFHIRKDIYKDESFRNKFSDRPIKEATIIEGYDYLYSTCLTTYSGSLKKFAAEMSDNANIGVEKFVKAYKDNPVVKKDIDSWKDDKNMVVRKMYESVMIKLENPELKFNDRYPFEDFKMMTGELDIIGLSPNNDVHLFEAINTNENLHKLTYYYRGDKDRINIKNLFPQKEVQLIDVKEFWDEF